MNWIENNRPAEKHDFLTFIGGGKSKFLEEFKKFESVKLSNFVQAQVLLGNIPARLGQHLLWRHHLLDLKGCSRPWDTCLPVFGIDWIRKESGNLHFA